MRNLLRYQYLIMIAIGVNLGVALFMLLSGVAREDDLAGRLIRGGAGVIVLVLSIGIGLFFGHAFSMTPGPVRYGPFRGLYRMGFVDLVDLRMRLTLAMAMPETLVHRCTAEPREVARARAVLAVLGLPSESDWVDEPQTPPAEKPRVPARLDEVVARNIREQLIIFHGYDNLTASEIISGYEHHGALTEGEMSSKNLLDPYDRWKPLMRRYLTNELVEAALAHINVHHPPALREDGRAGRVDWIMAWTRRSYQIPPLRAEQEAVQYLADGDPLEAHHFRNLRPMNHKERHDAVAAMYQNPGRRRAALADVFIELSELTTKS